MADSKTYLNVPYAQKDAAKALGARWDAASKKWYVPVDKDITLFTQWQTQSVRLDASVTTSKPRSGKTRPSAKNTAVGMITQATDKNFVAYDGNEPPWD